MAARWNFLMDGTMEMIMVFLVPVMNQVLANGAHDPVFTTCISFKKC